MTFYFILFYLFFFLSFLFSPFYSEPCGCQGLHAPAGQQASLRWEIRVQDIGPPETSQLHIISKISQRSPSQCQNPAQFNDQKAAVLDTLCQTNSKTGTQGHPLAERLPKIIIRSQTPQNTPSEADLPTRKTRYSLIHQKTGTSHLHRQAYTTQWTKLSHWGQTTKTTGNTKLYAGKRRPQTH